MVEGGGGATHSRELDQTPTWAVASVVAVIILLSILLEMVIHHVGGWFKKTHKDALFEALEKVKGELMVLGFISLLLTFCQNYIAKICVPLRVAETMLPCPYQGWGGETESTHGTDDAPKAQETGGGHHRRLLWNDRRFLLADTESFRCDPGNEPLISLHGLHQLHIFIFFLAIFHVIFSASTMMLGRLKIHGWKDWEQETTTHDYEFSNDPARFRLTHETSFVRSHTSFWTRTRFFFYVGSFFQQFFRSVRKSDYLTMRNGFVTVHLAPGSKFNFQHYILRSLEDDFKVVVGISPMLWASVVLFLLLNVHGWQSMFWISVFPLVIILAVGTKLQAIITQMALEIQERHAVVQGIPLVQVSDRHFWFAWPPLILYLIHLTLFQNAFQITYFLWIWYEFGLESCFQSNFRLTIVRVILGLLVQFMCSYITLPLYALVTQMGSTMKKSIFDEQTSKALKKWHMNAVQKKEGRKGRSPTRTLGGGGSPGGSPPGQSPARNFNSTVPSSNTDVEADTSSAATLIANVDKGVPPDLLSRP